MGGCVAPQAMLTLTIAAAGSAAMPTQPVMLQSPLTAMVQSTLQSARKMAMLQRTLKMALLQSTHVEALLP